MSCREIEKNQVRDEFLAAIKLSLEANQEKDEVLRSILERQIISIEKSLDCGIFSEREVRFFKKYLLVAQQCLS